MRFRAVHRFVAGPAAVAAVLADPSLYLELQLPDLDPVEVVTHRSDGARTVLLLRYGFGGRLDPMAVRLLGGRRLTWLQELRLDAQAGTGTLTMAAEGGERLLHGAASITLTGLGAGDGIGEEAAPAETERVLSGEIVVGVPGIGRMAERRIVPGLLARLDVEAAAVSSRLGS